MLLRHKVNSLINSSSRTAIGGKMSYTSETEQDEVSYYGETYHIDCPYCGAKEIEVRDVCAMPWGMDDEEEIECPECKKTFEIRPRYRFRGFFVYTDDDQMDD